MSVVTRRGAVVTRRGGVVTRRGAVTNSEKVEYETSTKQVLTQVALCGLEHRQQQTRVLIGTPEEYVHGHTLSIMLMQIKYKLIAFS